MLGGNFLESRQIQPKNLGELELELQLDSSIKGRLHSIPVLGADFCLVVVPLVCSVELVLGGKVHTGT